MTTQERIKAILQQDFYRVEKGRILRKDLLDEKFKVVPLSGDQIYLLKFGKSPEMFLWSDVLSVIDSMKTGKWSLDGDVLSEEKILGTVDVSPIKIVNASRKPKKPPVKKVKKSPTKKSKKKSQKLREKEIAYIRKNYLKISINKMSKELGVTRFPVRYIVQQIKAGKTLKYENK